jgi:site-specific recombinase XerC
MTTEMLPNHADLRHIQAILGYTSLLTTQVNTHANIVALKEVVRCSDPHGKARDGRRAVREKHMIDSGEILYYKCN